MGMFQNVTWFKLDRLWGFEIIPMYPMSLGLDSILMHPNLSVQYNGQLRSESDKKKEKNEEQFLKIFSNAQFAICMHAMECIRSFTKWF